MRPISDRTIAHVRSWAVQFHNVEISIGRELISALNTTTGRVETTFDESYSGYEGSARFWLSNDGQVVNVGDGDYSTVATYLSLPWDADPVPHLDEYAQIISAYDDPSLEGKLFRIIGVDGGGFMRPARRLQVTAVTSNRDKRYE